MHDVIPDKRRIGTVDVDSRDKSDVLALLYNAGDYAPARPLR